MICVHIESPLCTDQNKKDSQPEAQQFQTEVRKNTPVAEEDESRELVVVDGEAVVREALPKSDYDIINRWREINQGATCRLGPYRRLS